MTALSGLEWKGNIREISNLSQQICLSENRKELIDSFIHARCTPLHTPKSSSVFRPISNAAASGKQPADPKNPVLLLHGDLMPLKEALRQFETAYIQRALDQTGTLKEAADVLGISFSSLCRKKAELGISKAAGSGKKIPAIPFKKFKRYDRFFLMIALLIIPLPVLSSHHLLFRFFLPCKHCCHRKEGHYFHPLPLHLPMPV